MQRKRNGRDSQPDATRLRRCGFRDYIGYRSIRPAQPDRAYQAFCSTAGGINE